MGCRRKASKSELLRVVRRREGGVAVDPGANTAGRGAYVHRDDQCITVAVRTGSMARALKTSITGDRAGSLIEEVIKATESSRADP